MNKNKERAWLSDFLHKPRYRQILYGVLLFSVIIHLIAGIGAAAWIVAKHFQPPKAEFESKRIVKIEPQIIDPQLLVSEFEAASSRPMMDQRVASTQPTKIALPDVPTVPIDDLVEFDPTAMVDSAVSGFSGSGGGLGGRGGGTISFFGIRAEGRGIIICIDISGSMIEGNKGPENYERVEEEAIKAIEKLTENVTFGVMTFAREGASWKRNLQRAVPGAKESAIRWLKERSPARKHREDHGSGYGDIHGGTRLDHALHVAFDLKPDTLIILSDGQPRFQLGKDNPPLQELENGQKVDDPDKLLAWVKEQQSKLNPRIKIHTIAYKMGGSGAEFLDSLARQNGGRFKDVRD